MWREIRDCLQSDAYDVSTQPQSTRSGLGLPPRSSQAAASWHAWLPDRARFVEALKENSGVF